MIVILIGLFKTAIGQWTADAVIIDIYNIVEQLFTVNNSFLIHYITY